MRAAFFHYQMEETEAAIHCSTKVLKIALDPGFFTWRSLDDRASRRSV
jgi:hypothetical protein